MDRSQISRVIFLCAIFVSSSFTIVSAGKPQQDNRVLKINKAYDKRTVVKKSTIPNAGNGLFAAVKIKTGEVIGELGGRLVAADDRSLGNHYIASIPECAWTKTRPYKYLDSKKYGSNVSRINFAPSKINGIETHFQNAAIKQVCQHPYFIFVGVERHRAGHRDLVQLWSQLRIRAVHEGAGSSRFFLWPGENRLPGKIHLFLLRSIFQTHRKLANAAFAATQFVLNHRVSGWCRATIPHLAMKAASAIML